MTYKAINTLDSMVGYRNERYERFGKFSAKLDDIAGFIPSRFTSLIIALLFFSKDSIKSTLRFGSLHDSPNAGYPISAMAGAIDIKLGGDTKYFGKIKKKPYFGFGKEDIDKQDLINALSLQSRFDIFILLILGVAFVI
jgi:adenosylcobinamide-phosphate synthase